MITLSFFFWTLVVLFAVIGAVRGWVKELLVSFSIILALFLMQIALGHVGPVKKLWGAWSGQTQFYLSSLVIIVFAIFGYHTPNNQRINTSLSKEKKSLVRHWLQDIMLGGLFGACNGYLLVGTIWYFLHLAKYPVPDYIIIPPEAGTRAGDAALRLIEWLPPVWLQAPAIYFVVGFSLTFIIIVLL
ncbi:MAG: CvpA family protein [Candidatus Electrothrix sp. YB6]